MTESHIDIPTAFGNAAMVFSKRPFRIKTVVLPRAGDFRELLQIAGYADTRPGNHPQAQMVAEAIKAFFDARSLPEQWPFWPLLETSALTALQLAVLKAVARIPVGQVRSYGQIATDVGRPGAARFVGNTMAGNPFPVLIPCHRVIRSDGRIGQFGGGPELKQRILDLEKQKAQHQGSLAKGGKCA